MKELNSISLTRFAATMADLTGVDRPKCADKPIQWVEDVIRDICREPFDKVFIQNPDSCAQWMYQKYPDTLESVLKHTFVTVPFQTVMPSVTPVCFGTMYTGALPSVHGIQEYVKPIIKIESLFDCWIRAGKKVCLVSTETASMSNIFKDRAFDIFNCNAEGRSQEGMAIQKMEELILEDKYDVYILYSWMYDTNDHKYGPESKEALTALYRQSTAFDSIVSTIKRHWKKYNTLISFSTDHGCHAIDPKTDPKGYLGHHGTDSPLDLNILHFLGAIPKSE